MALTFLHEFANQTDAGFADLQHYLISREPSKVSSAIHTLQGLIAALNQELTSPSLQETVLLLSRATAVELDKEIADNNAVTLQSADYRADGVVEPGKLIRALAANQPPDSCFIFKVTLVGPDVLILAPVKDGLPG